MLAASAPSPPMIDVLVVYTPAAASALGGEAAIQRAIQLGIDEMNLQLQNSEISLSMRLVHSGGTSGNTAST